MWRSTARAALILAVFAACITFGYLPKTTFPVLLGIGKAIGPYGYSIIVNTVWIVVPVIALSLQHRSLRAALADLGILTSPLRPLFLGLVATAPASIGFALTGHINHTVTLRAFLFLCVYSPFAEEMLFRAFAFGQLYRRAEWGFRTAVLLPTVLFAAGHFSQSHDPGEIAGILAITALGSVVFSYFFVRMGWTIWAPFAPHAFLNTWWTLFTSNQTALGGMSDNIFRFGSIALAFLLTLAAARVPAFRIFAPKEGAWRSDTAADA